MTKTARTFEDVSRSTNALYHHPTAGYYQASVTIEGFEYSIPVRANTEQDAVDMATKIANRFVAFQKMLDDMKFISKELHQHVDYGEKNNPVTYASQRADEVLADYGEL